MSGDQIGYFVYFALLLIFIGSGVFYMTRERLSQNLQYAAIWALIFLGVVVVYGFRDTLERELLGRQSVAGGTITLPRAEDGHFYMQLQINDTPVRFVVDTGASQIVLTREDAARIGIDPDGLAYLGRAFTANGEVRTARVVLDSVRFGAVTDRNVQAVVNDGDLFESLLGMTYLGRFQDISIRGDQMVLTR